MKSVKSILILLLAPLFCAGAARPQAATIGAQSAPKKASTPAHPAHPAAHPIHKVVPMTVTTASGLQYLDLLVGKGEVPKAGDKVLVDYTGRFKSGKVFDSSVGKKPFEFTLGQGEVIKGWDEGVATMHVGGRRKLTIPPQLAYGPEGRSGIPPNSTLIFAVKLLKIE